MTELYQINVKLSQGQKRKLAKAYRDNEEVSIRLAHKNLSGSDTLMVHKNTVNRVAKSKGLGKGVQLKISKANVRKQTGSGILTSLLPVLRNVAPTIGKTVGLSALAGLASEGASQLGDTVRISKYKRKTFDKGHTPNWTEEVFVISEIQPPDPITYKIKDFNGEEIKGTFYGEELQETDQTIYRIEKVIRKTKDKALVKWKGYPAEFNSWIPLRDLQSLALG